MEKLHAEVYFISFDWKNLVNSLRDCGFNAEYQN